MAAAPTSHQLAAGAPWSSLPRGGFRALTDSAPASVRFSVGRRRAARLGPSRCSAPPRFLLLERASPCLLRLWGWG
uniref:Uncharacterized protein n=1 Tax=Aegilops tauschii subsp. strangulata TaxID=200361 RepID=A0A453IHL0_AEGTS